MQAISRIGHEKFCKLVQNIKTTQLLKDDNLFEKESELENIFNRYKKKLIEIKELIIEYEERKKTIRQNIKYLQRNKEKKVV